MQSHCKWANYSNQQCLVFSWHQPHNERGLHSPNQLSFLYYPDLNHKLATHSLWQALPIIINCIQSVNDWQLSVWPITEAAAFIYNASWRLKSYFVEVIVHWSTPKFAKAFKGGKKKLTQWNNCNLKHSYIRLALKHF